MPEIITFSAVDFFKQHYDRIKETLEKDKGGFASTMLHPTIARFNEIVAIQQHYTCTDRLDMEDNSYLIEYRKPIKEIIKDRLQKRLIWLADGIDKTIESRKQKGTYKGEFTTSVIMANAFNDLLHGDFGTIFHGKE